MKLVSTFIHKYVLSFCIIVFVLLSIIYLIMVSEVFNEVEVEYSRLQSAEDHVSLDNIYDLGREEFNKAGVTSRLVKKTLQKTHMKLILLWSPLFEGWNFLQEGKHSFETSGCMETRCEITSDRSRILESDAVLFHLRTLSMFDLPGERTSQQKWVFLNLEAPPYSRFQGFDFMFRMFNWTMTYRKDSDVYIPYGRIVQGRAKDDFNLPDLYSKWKNKSKLAVWMVSHCSTSGNREKYIEELKDFMEVDTYGSCGIGICPFNKTNLCVENFSKQYYFFLAFENAICDDYVTEKLFRTFQYDMIPVVFGGANYTSIAPANSFIDALKFSSPGQLSSHLLRVSSNFTLFSQYFEWRKTSSSDDTPNHCELCQKLHSEEFTKYSVYDDINEWWIKKSNCRKWKKDSIVE